MKISKYKRIGEILVFISIIPAIIFQGYIRIIITLSILIISYLFFKKYKCPFCGHVFDPRLDTLEYCNKCGEKLEDVV